MLGEATGSAFPAASCCVKRGFSANSLCHGTFFLLCFKAKESDLCVVLEERLRSFSTCESLVKRDVSWGDAGNNFSGVWHVSGELAAGGARSPGACGLGSRYQTQVCCEG